MTLKNIIRSFYVKTEKKFAGGGLNRYSLIRKIARYFRDYLKSDIAIIDGHKLYLDSEDSLRLSINNEYEKFETTLIKSVINPGDKIIDLGANIGYYTLLFARLVGESGKVFAFEPETTNFELLKKNVQENNYKNIILEKKAVSDKSGVRSLYLIEDNKAGNSLIKPVNRDNLNEIKIQTITLDEYLTSSDKDINFMKMDVEGAEGFVIQGMLSILESSKQLILMTEFYPLMLNQAGYNPKTFLNLLAKNGFELFYIDRKHEKLIRMDMETLFEQFNIKKQNHANLLCFKGDFPKSLNAFFDETK